jgi:predicted metalloprotease with PDZ domain
MARPRAVVVACVLALAAGAWPGAQSPVSYRLSFEERVHRLMQVELALTDVPPGRLELRMSRTSPGRYALHEFAKNVFDVRITDAAGRPLVVTRPSLHQWDVADPPAEVRVGYRVFGDRVDGTYLGIDTTHAHINMPAALMWARGFEQRPVIVSFEQPPGSSWRVATQLLTGGNPFTFSAPNLQYLMDSPTEFSAFALRTFTINDGQRTPVFRVALHHQGTDAELDGFARDVESIVREARHVFREFPAFEGNTYTFIADYLPWASGDGMEHRNSTILTSARPLSTHRLDLLDTVSHEFFHAWNVERIRPAALEPFDFGDASVTTELWLAEGFTSYYGPLVMKRADLYSLEDFLKEMGRAINTVRNGPGRQFRSLVEMSRFAPLVDAATSTDPTNFDNTFISYYTWGEAVALGLDLVLRERSAGRATLDDFMRTMWTRFGTSAARSAGAVAAPYTGADVRAVLSEVAGDEAFASDFLARYVEGRDVVDYAPLLARAGIVMRPAEPGRAFAGEFTMEETPRGPRITSLALYGSPLHAAGLDRDDVIVSLRGTRVMRSEDVDRLLGMSKPGEEVAVVFERRGQQVKATIELAENPAIELVAAESAGQTLTAEQRRFREAWLSSAARNAF